MLFMWGKWGYVVLMASLFGVFVLAAYVADKVNERAVRRELQEARARLRECAHQAARYPDYAMAQNTLQEAYRVVRTLRT